MEHTYQERGTDGYGTEFVTEDTLGVPRCVGKVESPGTLQTLRRVAAVPALTKFDAQP